jgi:hypothetical protein
MKRYILLMSLTMMSSCVVTPEEQLFNAMQAAPHVYTQTDLHPHERRSALYTMNYQMDGLIPVCTEVRPLQLYYDYMEFQAVQSGRVYTYQVHANPGEDFIHHINKYFGNGCDKDKISRLSEIDQKGILKGRALIGMSRQGVIYALGYPPPKKTPSLDNYRWWYWKNRVNRFYVEFDQSGKVVKIRN